MPTTAVVGGGGCCLGGVRACFGRRGGHVGARVVGVGGRILGRGWLCGKCAPCGTRKRACSRRVGPDFTTAPGSSSLGDTGRPARYSVAGHLVGSLAHNMGPLQMASTNGLSRGRSASLGCQDSRLAGGAGFSSAATLSSGRPTQIHRAGGWLLHGR